MADYTEEIAHLKKIVNNGISTVVVDGVTTSFDLAHSKKRLIELEAKQAKEDGTANPRPRYRPINLG